MEELHVTNKPKLSQNDRGPHPQRDYVPPPCVQRESRDRGSLPGSVTLLVCQDRCAALSQIPGGWLGVSLNSAAKTSMLLSYEA